jgi:amino-acid N-acetyltransferase
MNGEFRIRAADIRDAERIFALIHLNRDQLVPRSMGNIVENIDRFTVAETEEEPIGCASFVIHPEIGDIGSSTVEVQSVAVKKAFRRRGVGKALVEAVADRIRSFGPMEILVLTFAPDFFGSLGFSEIPKTKVMHKLYTGCINCTKHANPFTCPEIAMIRKA